MSYIQIEASVGLLQEFAFQDPLEATRIVLQGLLSQVPYVGDLASTVLELFWPQQEVNMWEQIKDQVHNAIETALVKFKINSIQGAIFVCVFDYFCWHDALICRVLRDKKLLVAEFQLVFYNIILLLIHALKLGSC